MPVSLADLIADILQDYDLTQAFIRLGMHLYGSEWNLNFRELASRRKPPNPAEVKENHDKLEAEKSRLMDLIKIEELKISKSTSENEIKAAEITKAEFWNQLSKIHAGLNSLPTLGESLDAEWAAYNRRVETEKILISALAKRELAWWSPFGTPGDIGPWERRPGYGYSIELSLVWWNKRIHGCRRQFVRIYRKSFDEWVKTIQPINADAIKKLSPAEQAAIWLQDEIAKNARPRMTRDEYVAEMMKLFPGLSMRAAKNQVWGRFAPDSWKKAGAKRKK